MALQDLFFNKKDDRVSDFLYSLLNYSFGLPGRYALSHGQVEGRERKHTTNFSVTWSGEYINSFSIAGRSLIVQFFMLNDSSNLFNRVDRDIVVPNGKRYAYDFSRIQDGVLSAKLEYEGSTNLIVSDEIRALLNMIWHNGYAHWENIPLAYIEAGPIYVNTGIPDRIYMQLPASGELSEAWRNGMIGQIANRYNVANYPGINVLIYQDKDTSTMNFQASVKPPEQEFPFGYYHSLGLIDDNGMVAMETFLGVVAAPANSEEGKKYLIEAGRKIQEAKDAEAAKAEVGNQQVVNDFFNPQSSS